MFRELKCPSLGVCYCIVELPHWLFRFWFAVCCNLGADRHPNSNTQQIKNETASVVVQKYSRMLLKMGILIPETC
jgi:hypothetical protein